MGKNKLQTEYGLPSSKLHAILITCLRHFNLCGIPHKTWIHTILAKTDSDIVDFQGDKPSGSKDGVPHQEFQMQSFRQGRRVVSAGYPLRRRANKLPAVAR